MRTACVLLSVALPVVGLATPAVAADAGPPVRVTAVVSDGAGGVVVQSRPAASLRAGRDLVGRWGRQRGVRAVSIARPVRATAVDPLRGQQWGLTRLQAEQAWLAGPATGQVVAVVDTGVDGTHPDLASVLTTGKDLLDPAGTGRTDPNGHGTHVAGIVAAVSDSTGVAGLAQGARIMPVRALDADGAGYDDDVARGVVWAVDNGATVVNLSLGGDYPSPVLTAAIAHALLHDVLVVAASGNAGLVGDPVLYPAATAGVLAVGATGSDDALAGFSSTGPHLGLAAPGVDVLSTLPGGWGSGSGTSMAAPFVAAAAAMVQADAPSLPVEGVRTVLTSTALDLGAPGRDSRFGFGLLDVVAARTAARAAQAALQPVAAVVTPVVEAVAPVVEAVVEPTVEPAPLPVEPSPAPVVASPSPSPSPAPTPAPPPAPVVAVRISRSASVVTPGAAVTISTRVLADGRGSGGRTAVLERRVGSGPWAVLRTATTAPDGLASWVLRPDRTGEHRVRSGSAVSTALAVAVRQVVATTAAARSGGSLVVSGGVRPGGAGPVWLQVRSGTGWRTVATATSASDGRVRVGARLAPGTVVRLHSPARPALLAGTSPARTAP